MQVNISQNLPKGKLIEELINKVNEGNPTIDVFGTLDNFRKLVSDQVRHINELFPEYTPHDELYHLKRLFTVTEVILGPGLLTEMSMTELFLLALSLYGHDWGMAVSNDERDRLLGKNKMDFDLLENEEETFTQFLTDNGATKDNFPHELWQDYVRRTHALRSAERVRKHFLPIDQGVGEAVARICEAHWLDLKELLDNTIYPTNFSVLGELVNLRAISVYLRLIDLMDIGSDRTPFVVWKYVSPRNEFSKMEWEKHRALQPVTSAPYQDGRILIIDGTTDNHNVYAALTDLKNYCDEQIKGCTNILAQLNDPIHKLNIYHAEWRIHARNFKPISIQFEFDRLKMFEVLSDEIYKGDIHVFLRELLQNSVDAIKMRREILDQRGVQASNVGHINIEIKEYDNGDMDIIFSDDGIGMDEYVIKNFLSVAGKSYYSSREFQKLGLQMDPISRFGVGILSCFMVADEIEIETYKDPYSTFSSEKLKIKIPSVNKQFRIESQQTKNAKVGTSILVKVLHSKLVSKGHSKIDVKAYLTKIVGFVDFPITIHQGAIKFAIFNHYETPQVIKKFKERDYETYKTSINFPFDDAFQAHSVLSAQELLQEKSLDLKGDLNMDGIEGKVVFLLPKDENLNFHSHYGKIVISKGPSHESIEKLDLNIYWTDDIDDDDNENNKSGTRIRLYLDGILIDEGYKFLTNNIPYPFGDSNNNDIIILPFAVINITK